VNPLFPVAPEDFTTLSAEELGDLLASYQEVSRALKAGEVDLSEHFPDMDETETSAAVMDAWREAATVVQAIRARQDELAAELAEGERLAAELHAAISPEETVEVEPVAEGEELAAADDDEEDDGEGSDKEAEDGEEALAAEAVEEAEAVTAAAISAPRTVRYPAVAKKHEAPAPARNGAVAALIAADGSDTVRRGSELSPDDYSRLAVETARRRGKPAHTRDGGRERILLATADIPFPKEFVLDARDPQGNAEKLAAVGSPYLGSQEQRALTAAADLCAPPTPFYNLPSFTTTTRPVRDGLPSFNGDRGGVSVPSVSTLGSAADAITVIEYDGEGGGSTETKSCLDVECAAWTDTFVGAIAHCRKVGNLNARTWPEGVAHENENTMAYHARTAEGRLLDMIDALSIDLTRAAVYGASSSLLYALQISRVGIISRLRMDRNTRFNVILPFWAAEMFSLDIVNSQYDRFDTPPENVGALFSRFGFNVIWHLDEGIDPAADTEVWPDEVDGTVQEDWPGSIVVARLFPAGHFIHLDGGTLELGLVRDSTLNETNDYELFGETFESVFAVGPTQAAHRLEITACPTGSQAALTTAITCSAT